MYRAIDLSKYIVSKCVIEKSPISNLQLQKILYYIQKDFLSRGPAAFQDEIEAWQFGPVVPDVYYYFCGYGAMPITFRYDSPEIDSADVKYINSIVEEKRQLRPWDLVKETHRQGGAWDQTYRNGLGNHKVIPQQLIKEVG